MTNKELRNKVILFYMEYGKSIGKSGTARLFNLPISRTYYWLANINHKDIEIETLPEYEKIAKSIEGEWR